MKWSIYKRMSKAHKEEYNYRFQNPQEWAAMKWGMATIAIIGNAIGNNILLILFGSFYLIIMAVDISQSNKEKQWLDQHGYYEKKND